jgi:type II secretory pathway pseudopilin PulG
MALERRRIGGFTLVEMMITIAVVIVLLLIAVPSFIAIRQRSTLNGAGDQVLSLWNQGRMEAAKRNERVKFGVNVNGTDFCIGLATTADPADTTACDCFDAAATTNQCNVAMYPSAQADWNNVTLSGTPTLGENTGVVVIEPKRTALTDLDDAGAVTLAGPPGQASYLLNLRVDPMGRAVLCESTSAVNTMPAYTERRCGP